MGEPTGVCATPFKSFYGIVSAQHKPPTTTAVASTATTAIAAVVSLVSTAAAPILDGSSSTNYNNDFEEEEEGNNSEGGSSYDDDEEEGEGGCGGAYTELGSDRVIAGLQSWVELRGDVREDMTDEAKSLLFNLEAAGTLYNSLSHITRDIKAAASSGTKKIAATKTVKLIPKRLNMSVLSLQNSGTVP